MEDPEVKSQLSIEDRITNLNQFRELWVEFGNFVGRVSQSKNLDASDEETYQKFLITIAKMFPRVQVDIQRHGLKVAKAVPAGGGLYRNVQNYMPFLNIASVAPSLPELFQGTRFRIQEFSDDLSLGDRILLHAIGTLEFAQEIGSEAGLPVQENEPAVLVEVLSAIRRALRPAIKNPPESEKEVQDQVDTILRAQGVKFERESQMEHATKKVRPDFVLPALDTAIEIKLCKSTEREKDIIEEIGSRIVAFRKKYQIILFIVYDVATISDTQAFIEGFSGELGVLVEIIKH